MPHTNEEKVEVTEHANGTIKANGIQIFSPHTNEEMRGKLFKLWKELRLEDKTSFEEIPAVIQIENFINQELSDLKKSIREEIEIEKIKALAHPIQILEDSKIHQLDNYNCGYNKAIKDVLSLKSLE